MTREKSLKSLTKKDLSRKTCMNELCLTNHQLKRLITDKFEQFIISKMLTIKSNWAVFLFYQKELLLQADLTKFDFGIRLDFIVWRLSQSKAPFLKSLGLKITFIMQWHQKFKVFVTFDQNLRHFLKTMKKK